MNDFPGHKTSTLGIMAFFKFESGAYTIDDDVKHFTREHILSALTGNVDPTTDVSTQIPGLPSAISQSLMKSSVQIAIVTYDSLTQKLNELRDDILLIYEQESIATQEGVLDVYLREIGNFITDIKEESALGYFSSSDGVLGMIFGGDTIIFCDNCKGGELSRIQEMANTLKHEAGHAIDWINGVGNQYASDSVHFHQIFEEKFLQNIPDTVFLHHVTDITFLEHCKSYENSEKPYEVVAEIISKYSHTYNAHAQIAEIVINHDFPYIWPAVKDIIPQIEDSLIGQGYDKNARPLYSNPSLYVLHDKYFSSADDNGHIYMSIFGLSSLEKASLKDLLSRHDIGIEERHESFLDWYVFHESDAEKLESLRGEIKKNIDVEFLGRAGNADFLRHIKSEERRVKKLLPSVNAVDVRIGFDGSLLLDMHQNFDAGNRLSCMTLNGFAFNNDYEIYSSSPEHISYAVPYDKIPGLYKPDLTISVGDTPAVSNNRRPTLD